MLVGLSMALSIAISIVAFIWIYVRLGPLLSDFIPASTSAATPTSQPAAAATPSSGATPQAVASEPAATPAPSWLATHRIAEGPDVNFRAGPTTISQRLTSLPPGTELKFLGEQQQTGRDTWMHFQLQDGTQGWVRSIDVVPISP